MKKIALIMALVLVFACALVACDTEETNSTPANESSVVENNSEEIENTESSAPADESTPADESAPADESEPAEESAPAATGENLAAGKTYTYPTDGLYIHWDAQWACSKTADTALTDGVTHADYYGDASMVGWSQVDVEIVIDLGSAQTVNGFKYYAFGGLDGIELPSAVEVLVSTDGTNWTPVTTTAGEPVAIPSTLTWVTGSLYSVELTAASSAEAQYVKFVVTRNGPFAFFTEIEVLG